MEAITLTRLKHDALYYQRDVLLTCCFDGAVRLWNEINNGKGCKLGKETNDLKIKKRLFHVTAVIEIKQCLNGTLGIDTFVRWTKEIRGMVAKGADAMDCFSTEDSEYGRVGKCEWLVGMGPGTTVTFWAIHCLDDISPLRCPRVHLWKKRDNLNLNAIDLCKPSYLNSKNRPIFVKGVILRSQVFGPPTECTLLQLLPDNSLSWSQFFNPASNDAHVRSSIQTSEEKSLSCFSSGLLSQDGHSGNILQVSIHPYSCEVELAVSLDSDGCLLFWSLATISNCTLGMPGLFHPTWKFSGKILTCDLYSSLTWAPSVSDENRLLLVGHSGGIDCIILKISNAKQDKILDHQKVGTIPFPNGSIKRDPDHIFATALSPTCHKTFISNRFMLIAIWMKGFQALSWKVVLHAEDLSGKSCGCGFNATSETKGYKSSFSERRYCVIAEICSSMFSNTYDSEHVTSFAVVSANSLLPSVQQKWASFNDFCNNSCIYHMATGCDDGHLKLWRIITRAESSVPLSEEGYLPWELVGMFDAHHGPVDMISLSNYGGKIATVSSAGPGNINYLHMWDSMSVLGAGSFLQEDKIPLDGVVIALDWFPLGNGQFLLGVCLQNELRVYAQKRCAGQVLGKLEKQLWFCIAVSHTSAVVQDFLWGPRAIPVVVHKSYFSLLSQWSFATDRKCQAKLYPKYAKGYLDERDEEKLCTIYTDGDVCDLHEKSLDEGGIKVETSVLPSKSNMINGYGIQDMCLTINQQRFDCCTGSWVHSVLDIAVKLRESLPIYHPMGLLWCLYSGNWERAFIAMRHLVAYLDSKESLVEKSSHVVPQILLSKYFQKPVSTTKCDNELTWFSSVTLEASLQSVNVLDNGSNVASSKFEIPGFIKTLENYHSMLGIIDIERTQVLAIVDLLNEVSDPHRASPYESLDEPARRFWVAIRFQQLQFIRKFGRSVGSVDLLVGSDLIAWACLSDCQENLFSSLLSNEPSWPEMRNLGVGFWFTSATPLRARMEKLARLQYLKKRDPKDCALMYMALNRLQVLAGLFKISRDEKDKLLVGFLSRNFQEEKNKAAALKNAYVLLGRHQLELAIAFFLLGGDSYSAVTVCAKNHGDEQLALVICRLMEGYGGPLERALILNYLLPNAIEKRDYWLCSLLEWTLGNYTRCFLHLLNVDLDSAVDKSDVTGNNSGFSDPNIGSYCAVLAAKNGVRNSLGDSKTLVLARWATLMTSCALDRCGLALEALECLSSSSSIPDCKDQGIVSVIGKINTLHGILKPAEGNASCNWLSGDLACSLESHFKLNLAMNYISKLLPEHPSWSGTDFASAGLVPVRYEHEFHRYKLLLDRFRDKLNVGLSMLEQKYALNSADAMNMILVFSSNNGMLFLGYHMLHGYSSLENSQDKHCAVDVASSPLLPKILLKSCEEICYVFARYIAACITTNFATGPTLTISSVFGESRSGWIHPRDFYLWRLLQSILSFQPLLKISSSGSHVEDLTARTLAVLGLLEYSIHFASTWLQRNSKGLVLMIRPAFHASNKEHTSAELITADLNNFLRQTAELMIDDTSCANTEKLPSSNYKRSQHGQNGSIISLVSENEKWKLIEVCLWLHLFNFFKAWLCGSTQEVLEDDYSSRISNSLVKLLMSALGYISSALTNELASFLRQKSEKGFPIPSLVWLEESLQSQPRARESDADWEIDRLQNINNEKGSHFFEILWEVCVSPQEICQNFLRERIHCFHSTSHKVSGGWKDMQHGIVSECEIGDAENYEQQGRSNSVSSRREAGIHARSWSSESNIFMGARQKDLNALGEVTCFHNPKEVVKRNGELLEAICVNSCDPEQVALASNRKGLLFFKWKNEEPSREQAAEYIWSKSDWPRNGWAGSESTPVPTVVSPGIGLGSKKGAHLGLGGATIGLGSLARPGKDLTGGGAFGIPGYAGIGASGLGWGEQNDFEEFVDPPATIENISTRALSSHPLMPLFLVGSSNTHIYLWEFGKDKATATYGVLPAANVPPPYALASISALQFDHCGHRFTTAALDGTVCTWQLEVGGRSNVRPTESCLCFNNHASDVAYVGSSGSIVAAAGSSSNGVNVVVWDTLAPPATSQASLICHEGGARSLSVFDHDIGSSSISPLIVTGGKGGDVGLHDFRFIATGKTKRQRHSNEQKSKSSLVNCSQKKFGEQNMNGMLWHIPRAHLGSITRISTIPNTSLFLTGSKDGDVKLWDAKRCGLIFHWQKLHDRHTFLQPNSRGFGGVVRVAVTDIQVLTHGFLSCGGDGFVRLVQLNNVSSFTNL